MAVARPEAVLQDKGRNPAFVEPFGNLPAFMIHRQMGVPAAGADDHRSSVRGGRFGEVDGECRRVLCFFTHRAGRALRPQLDGVLRHAGLDCP